MTSETLKRIEIDVDSIETKVKYVKEVSQVSTPIFSFQNYGKLFSFVSVLEESENDNYSIRTLYTKKVRVWNMNDFSKVECDHLPKFKYLELTKLDEENVICFGSNEGENNGEILWKVFQINAEDRTLHSEVRVEKRYYDPVQFMKLNNEIVLLCYRPTDDFDCKDMSYILIDVTNNTTTYKKAIGLFSGNYYWCTSKKRNGCVYLQSSFDGASGGGRTQDTFWEDHSQGIVLYDFLKNELVRIICDNKENTDLNGIKTINRNEEEYVLWGGSEGRFKLDDTSVSKKRVDLLLMPDDPTTASKYIQVSPEFCRMAIWDFDVIDNKYVFSGSHTGVVTLIFIDNDMKLHHLRSTPIYNSGVLDIVAVKKRKVEGVVDVIISMLGKKVALVSFSNIPNLDYSDRLEEKDIRDRIDYLLENTSLNGDSEHVFEEREKKEGKYLVKLKTSSFSVFFLRSFFV